VAAWLWIFADVPDLNLLVGSLAIGIAIAAPLGPVNILVIRAALKAGFAGGLAAGIGSLLADSFFATIAAYGLRSIEMFIADHATWLNIAGGCLLAFIGIRMARSSVSAIVLTSDPEPVTKMFLLHKAATTFATTITNPGALIGVFALFGSMANVLKLDSAPYRPGIAVLCFLLGGLLWWVFLSAVVKVLRHRLSLGVLNRINRWTGILIAGFGFALLSRAFG